ncbi:hypothetical protein EMCRGX_G022555 [Ephydatia muelleri]
MRDFAGNQGRSNGNSECIRNRRKRKGLQRLQKTHRRPVPLYHFARHGVARVLPSVLQVDYVQLFGIQCAGCDSQIQPNDLVMRAKNQVFHMECFKCSSCDCKLLPGDQYGISNGRLLCRSDLDVLCEGVQSPTDTGSGSEGSGSGTVEGSGSGTVGHKAGSIKRQNSEKGPRVRTVLTEQQLQTLRNVYAANPRPDALLKEHLVERTGLSSRVIRVWFQNKRCKDKKRAIQQAEARLQQTMPPLTPQTPLTPDTLGQISPRHGMASFTYSPSATPRRGAHLPAPILALRLAWPLNTKNSCQLYTPHRLIILLFDS